MIESQTEYQHPTRMFLEEKLTMLIFSHQPGFPPSIHTSLMKYKFPHLEELGDGSNDGAVSQQDGRVSANQGEVAITAKSSCYIKFF